MNNLDHNTPILFLIFNRPETTMLVLEGIRKAKPKRLYIASDGPRASKEKESDIVLSLRQTVLDNIDWPCEVKILFRTSNLGCKIAVSTAIDWVFEESKQAIILEDDCVPDPSFFSFCEDMLNRYQEDDRVLSINGYNPLGIFKQNESYFFSKYFFSWGWATWKRAWNRMDLEFEHYKKAKEEDNLSEFYPSLIERKIRQKRIEGCITKKSNSWAIPWNTVHQLSNAYAILPAVNLIENIGFSNESATHTTENYWDNKFLNHKAYQISLPLDHPKEIAVNKDFTKKYLNQEFKRIALKKISGLLGNKA